MSNDKNGGVKKFAVGVVFVILAFVIFICVFHAVKKSADDPGTSSSSASDTADTLPSQVESVSVTESEYSLVDPSSINTDFSCFDNCAFIGNSRLLALGNYGIAKNVYAKVSLNVNTVFTDPGEGRKVPVINELDGKQFDKIFIMFGDNECGWGSMEVFTSQYKKVIAAAREKVPGAQIILLSTLPISKTKSDENLYGYNKDALIKMNGIIEQIAEEENCKYIKAGVDITGSDGYLPESYSADGAHLLKDYCMVWARTVADNM